MAKRAAADEKPYRPPLDADLVSVALSHAVPGMPAAASSGPNPYAGSAKIVEMPRGESFRRTDHAAEVNGGFTGEVSSVSFEDERTRQAVQVVVEKFDHEKRILFTRPESQAIDRLVVSLATRLNSQVKVSYVVRALVALLLNAEAKIDRRAGGNRSPRGLANGDAQGLQKFEREIGKIIAAALRDSGPLR